MVAKHIYGKLGLGHSNMALESLLSTILRHGLSVDDTDVCIHMHI